MTMSVLNTIANGAAANATPVDDNFDTIATYVDTDLINKDGTVAMAPGRDLTLAQAPSSDLHASTKKYVDDTIAAAAAAAAVPPGTVSAFAGASAPTGYLLCDGASVSQATYADLYTAIGVSYGDPGGGNFNLPDLQDRFPVGKGSDALFNTLGETGGSTDAAVVSHSHTMPSHDHGAGTYNVSIDHDHGEADLTRINAGGKNWHLLVQTTGGAATAGFGSVDFGYSAESAPGTASLGYDGLTNVPTQKFNMPNYNVANRTLSGDSQSVNPGDTNPFGDTGDDANVPPYIAINYIIKT